MLKKMLIFLLMLCLSAGGISTCTVSADDGRYEIDVNQTLKTTRTESAFHPGFLSVCGYAKGNVKDRTEYIGTPYYRTVSSGDEFVKALADAREGKVKVIEVTDDINLGYYELSEETRELPGVDKYEDPTAGITNPTILQSGVTKLSIDNTDGLTVFSKSGNCIRHTEIKLQYTSKDLIFRNLEFDDMWQWDEAGNHKEVGWSFFKINGAKNVWIDHCTFSFAADALIDLENASSGVTYSWCRFGKAAEAAQPYEPVYKTVTYMEYLYQHGQTKASGRYAKMRNAGADPELLMQYEKLHSKCFGVGNEKQFKDMGSGSMPEDSAQRVRLTMAYNYLTNVGQRIPRLSVGRAHLFNLYIDNMSHAELKKNNKSLADGGLNANQCIDVHTSGSCAADTCVFYGVDKPAVGREYQGEYGGTGLAADPVLSHCWRDAKNRELIIHSSVTTTSGESYTGSSWDNNGENLLIESSYWKIDGGQTVSGTPKSTIGNWAWASNIVGVENMSRERPPATPFVFEDDTEATLGYDYQVVPLEDVKNVVTKYSGAYTYDLEARDWLRVTYGAEESIQPVPTDQEVLAERIHIREEDQTVAVDTCLQLNADVKPGNVSNRNVTWTSSNPEIMEVKDSGLVIVHGRGEAVITAVAQDGSGASDEIRLQSRIAVEKIKISPSSKTISAGDSLQMTAQVIPENADNQTLLWSSSNPSAANVDENGLVTALKKGTAIITCKSEDDPKISVTARITVKEASQSPEPEEPSEPAESESPEPSESAAPDYRTGDPNMDGKITAEDALYVLQAAAKLIQPSNQQYSLADTDRDGALTAEDALQILKYAAKLIDTL